MKRKHLIALVAFALTLVGCGNNKGKDDPIKENELKGTITLSQDNISVETGKSVEVTASYVADEKDPKDLSNYSFSWTVVSSEIASITPLDNKCTVNGVKEGDTKVKVSYGNVSKDLNLRVYKSTPEIINVTSVSLDVTEKTIEPGETFTLTPTILPNNATDKSVTWVSSNTAVATVTNGVVKGVAKGNTTITVETVSGLKTATCNVVVKDSEPEVVKVTGVSLDTTSKTVKIGDTFTLTPTVLPSNATNKAVSWASDNTDVATVSNGEITAIGSGTANITVTTVDGSKTAQCVVTVEENEPVPVFDDYILHIKKASSTEWIDVELAQNTTKESEYYIQELEMSAGDTFVIHMNETVWYGYSDLKTGCTSLVSNEVDTNNIVINEDGKYDIYSDFNVENGGHIWISKSQEVVPPTPVSYYLHGLFNGEKENWTDIELAINPDNSNEYYITGLELLAGDEFVANMNGNWFHYNDVKEGCRSLVTANGENIVINESASYDIYIDITASSGNRIWIQKVATETAYYGLMVDNVLTVETSNPNAGFYVDIYIPRHSFVNIGKVVGTEITKLAFSESVIEYDEECDNYFSYDAKTNALTNKLDKEYRFTVDMTDGVVTRIKIWSIERTQFSFYVDYSGSIPEGYSLYVIGNFCDWKLSGALEFHFDYDRNQYVLLTSIGKDFGEYKYILSETDFKTTIKWENTTDGNNRTVTGTILNDVITSFQN